MNTSSRKRSTASSSPPVRALALVATGCFLLFTAASAIGATAQAISYGYFSTVLFGATTLVLLNVLYLRTAFAANCQRFVLPRLKATFALSRLGLWAASAATAGLALATLSVAHGTMYDLLWVGVAVGTVGACACPLATYCVWEDRGGGGDGAANYPLAMGALQWGLAAWLGSCLLVATPAALWRGVSVAFCTTVWAFAGIGFYHHRRTAATGAAAAASAARPACAAAAAAPSSMCASPSPTRCGNRHLPTAKAAFFSFRGQVRSQKRVRFDLTPQDDELS